MQRVWGGDSRLYKTGTNRTVTYFVTKESFFFLLMECAIFKSCLPEWQLPWTHLNNVPTSFSGAAQRQLCSLHFYCDEDILWRYLNLNNKRFLKTRHFKTTYAGGEGGPGWFPPGKYAWDRSVPQGCKEPRQSTEAHDHYTWTHEFLHSASWPLSSSRVKCKGKTSKSKFCFSALASCFLSAFLFPLSYIPVDWSFSVYQAGPSQ